MFIPNGDQRTLQYFPPALAVLDQEYMLHCDQVCLPLLQGQLLLQQRYQVLEHVLLGVAELNRARGTFVLGSSMLKYLKALRVCWKCLRFCYSGV